MRRWVFETPLQVEKSCLPENYHVLSLYQVDQMEIKGKTMLNVPGYDAREKFEFGVMVYFAWEIEGTGTLLRIDLADCTDY
jgi:hypothetical protein